MLEHWGLYLLPWAEKTTVLDHEEILELGASSSEELGTDMVGDEADDLEVVGPDGVESPGPAEASVPQAVQEDQGGRVLPARLGEGQLITAN
jgi:hypothetical protein